MNILLYYPDNQKSISLSSLMIAFQKQGHKVFLLTQVEEGELHNDVKIYGIKNFYYPIKKKSSLSFYLKHISHLVSFTKKYQIDLVYSHIQRANFISVFAQYFSPSKFILCRHHSDCAFIDNNFNERLLDKIINKLGKEFIVPSQKVYDQMIVTEKVKNKKIHLIRYAYDFSQYAKPNIESVKEIRNKYKAKLLLVKVARLISEKRHILLFQVINKLVKKGFDIKLIVLSTGPEKEKLIDFIQTNNLQNYIFMVGYRTDVIDFISAADLVVHVSESEASSSLAKETGLVKKPLLVCKDVGDFDEYLVDSINSILINKEDPMVNLENVLVGIYEDKISIEKLGEELYKTIIERFSIQNILKEYDLLNVK
jgi:glycosyltransferase involved in cell wall biosynthesis